MGKKRLKLTDEQKRWHKHLEWFLSAKCLWLGEHNLKEIVLDGRFAVLSVHGRPACDCFTDITCVETMEEADLQIRWNPYTYLQVVDLEYISVKMTLRKPYEPEWLLNEFYLEQSK